MKTSAALGSKRSAGRSSVGKAVAKESAVPSGILAVIPEEPLDVATLKGMSGAELAEAINARLSDIDSAISRARAYAETALKAAIVTGHYLNEVRRRESGKWMKWLKEHCPGLSQTTADRYRRVAKKWSYVTNPPGMTLRQAYIVTGILPDAPPVKKQPPDLNSVPASGDADILAQVKSFRQFLQGIPLDMYEPPFLDQLSEEMSELITACEQVITKASPSRAIKQAKVRELPPASNSVKKGGAQ